MEQGTKEWFKVRAGRFTASEIHKLLGVKGLGLTGASYAFKNAIEIVFGVDEDDSFISFDMQRGIELEPLAFKKFEELKAFDFWDIQKASFFPFGENAGASPDGLVNKDAVLEIKCPKSEKFFNLVSKGIEAIDKEYIAQMQMEMLCTNSQRCHFFNYIIFKGQEMWHEIVIDRDEAVIDLIKSRIEEAVLIRDNFVKELNENRQF